MKELMLAVVMADYLVGSLAFLWVVLLAEYWVAHWELLMVGV